MQDIKIKKQPKVPLVLDEKNKIKLRRFEPSLFFGKERKVGSEPSHILEEIGIKENEVVVDFGCGVGFFVMEAGRLVGPAGKVIAVDINRTLLDSLKAKALESGLKNIYGVFADLETPRATGLDDGSADLVLIINLLYLVNKKEEVIREAERILKKGGKLAIMDWKEKGEHTALEKEQIVSSKTIKELAKKAGFTFSRSFEAGLSHEIRVFIK